MLLLLLLLKLLLQQLLMRKKPKKRTQQVATRIGCSDGGGGVDNVADDVVGTAGTMGESCHLRPAVAAFDASDSGTVTVVDRHFRFVPADMCHLLPRTVPRLRLWPPRTESSVDGGVVGEENGSVDFVVAVAEVDGTPGGRER